MRPLKIVAFALAFSVATAAPGLAGAQVLLIDPGIPDGERTSYVSLRGDVSETVTESVVILKEDGREFYEVQSRSEPQDITLKLDKETMAIVSVHSVRRLKGATFDLRVTTTDVEEDLEEGEVRLADFTALPYVLRGFPFGKIKSVKVRSLRGGAGRAFAMTVKAKGKETVKLSGGEVECYKLEIGMDSFWQRFFPKTDVWYSDEPPHHMVRYEGPGGPPGSPKRIVELVEYGKQTR